MCAAGSHLVDEEVWFPEHVRRNRNLGNSTKLIGVPWDAFIFPNLQPIKGELPGKIIFEINRALVSTVIRKCCFSVVRMKATKIYSPSSPRWREWKSVFSQSGNKHTHTHTHKSWSLCMAAFRRWITHQHSNQHPPQPGWHRGWCPALQWWVVCSPERAGSLWTHCFLWWGSGSPGCPGSCTLS